jgi:hypothetical protein
VLAVIARQIYVLTHGELQRINMLTPYLLTEFHEFCWIFDAGSRDEEEHGLC